MVENAPRLRTVGTPCDPFNPARNTLLGDPLKKRLGDVIVSIQLFYTPKSYSELFYQ